MRLPRWTVYPALAVLALFVVGAVPRRGSDPDAGAAKAARERVLGEPEEEVVYSPPRAGHERTVVLGIDGLDPDLLQEALDRFPERMRNFARLIEAGDGIHSLATSCPPQSPVAWSNFITGRNPGGHGIYDFIHRDTTSRGPKASTVAEVDSRAIPLFGDWQLPLGGDPPSNRSGESFWVTLARAGVPADIWRMPANFPVEPAEGLSFPGMMTPAMDSAYGVYKIYTTDPPVDTHRSGGEFIPVREFNGVIDTYLEGPPNSFREGNPRERIPLQIYVDHENQVAAIEIGEEVVVLEPGEWSVFLHASFDLLPGGISDASGIVRFYLRRIDPVFELYASPLNIDPTAPAMPVSQPEDASADLAEAIGLYYTQGMAEEVNALKDGAIDDREFMQQADLVYRERVRMMDYALDHYLKHQDGGLLFFYYSTIDLCCHMMWRVSDEQHPQHPLVADFAEKDSSEWSGRPESRWKDVVLDLYLKMDPVLGRVLDRVGEDATVIVMSDHGFAPYYRKFSLNTWLWKEGYLVLKPEFEPKQPLGDPDWPRLNIAIVPDGEGGDRGAVDWSRTRAYGMGFNGLYLNLAGRELDHPDTTADESGIVQPGAEAEALLEEIKLKLEAYRDPANGKQVVRRADIARDVYSGERLAEAPDIVVGYDVEYGNSDSASTGGIPGYIVADNMGGTFNGNHLMSPDVVPGILIANRPVRDGEHGLVDLTVEILNRYGVTPPEGARGHRVLR